MKLTASHILRGLAHQEYEMVYQPQYNITTMRIVGVEALLRWKQLDVTVSPQQVIDTCLEHGLIAKLGEVIMRRVCRQIATWQKSGYAIPVALNMNPIELTSDYPDIVIDAISDAGIPAELLEIEITEGADFPDFDTALNSMNRLAQMGITLTADDFGIGFSSLHNIARFPIQKIKIDRSFICNAPYLHADKAVVTSVIKLARSLKREVLAEGTETAEEVTLLRALGCELFQGHYFSYPLSPADFLKLLDNDNNESPYEKLAHC